MKRLRQPSNFALFLVGALTVAALVALLTLIVIRAHDQRQINQRICQVSIDNRDSLREVLLRSRDASLASTEDVDTRNRIRVFYADLLMTVPPLECRDGKPVEVT